MKKNILAENMRRFGTKNLSDVNKNKLKESILTEEDTIDSNTTVYIYPSDTKYKTKPDSRIGEVLVIQSATSLSEASSILGQMMKLVGQGKAESDEMITLIKKIDKNNYPAILWKIRVGNKFKSHTGYHYYTICYWLKNHMDTPEAKIKGTDIGAGFGIVDTMMGTKVAAAVISHLESLNREETFAVGEAPDSWYGE